MKEKNSKKELEYISNKLKETHVAPTTSLINYESETQSKFKKPILNDKNKIKLNTARITRKSFKSREAQCALDFF